MVPLQRGDDMTRPLVRLASLFALAIASALFAGAALAGNGNGNGNPNAPGQQKQSSSQPSNTAQSSTAPGTKPDNTTSKNTSCTTGGGTGTSATCSSAGSSKPDNSKRYGNGKTAAQIANAAGAPAGTKITGPGNSQPHKVAVCTKNGKTHSVDVHALKSHSTSCSSSSTSAPAQSSAAAAQSSAPTPAQSGVLGAVKTLHKPAHGVLGKTSKVGTLPFTGFPLWATALAALSLLAGGLVLRRQAQH
jgi:hypothetical protein